MIDLRGLDERWVELRHFHGHDTLVLFWNPGCGFCQRMRADLKAWEAQEAFGKPRLLIVSTGDAEANRAEGLSFRRRRTGSTAVVVQRILISIWSA